jgi:hypothetical protein
VRKSIYIFLAVYKKYENDLESLTFIYFLDQYERIIKRSAIKTQYFKLRIFIRLRYYFASVLFSFNFDSNWTNYDAG